MPNQKFSHALYNINFKLVAQLQKKLDEYERRKRDLETSGFSHGLGQYGNTSSHNSASDMHGATSGLASHATSSLGGSSKPAQTVRAGLKHVREGGNKVMSKPSDVMNSIMKSHDLQENVFCNRNVNVLDIHLPLIVSSQTFRQLFL